ncbi:MAG: ribosomal protein S18-alanine N-acetyltransferase [Candidatus Acidiferrales bacterium]
MEGLTIRSIAGHDVQAVGSIARLSPEAAQWPAADIERLVGGEVRGIQGWIGEVGGELAGFLVTRSAADEVEILNIAVAPQSRRAGVGSRLLKHALEMARAAGARRMFLEVRESNRAAIALYARHGFQPAGRRENCYSAPAEAALLLVRALQG